MINLNFPLYPKPGETYPTDLTPYDIRYQYDADTNSWNIIGPDNVATIEYVDNAVNNNNKNIRRNYDLHQTTNVLTLNDSFAHVRLDSAAAESGRNSLLTELYEDTSVNPPISSSVPLMTREEVAERSYTLEEWFYHCSQKSKEQIVDFFSFDIDNMSVNQGMTEVMPDIMGIWVDGRKRDGTEDLTHENFEVGSVIELKNILSQEQYGFDDNQYGLYKIVRKETEYIEIVRDANGNAIGTNVISYDNAVGLGVVFLYSYTGTDQPNRLVQSPDEAVQNYKLISYLKSLDKTGGDVTGELHIIHDSETTFTVRKDEDTDETLVVDTTNNDVTLNQSYNDELLTINTDHDLRSTSVATVGYVNDRLGVNNIYDNTDSGPFVRIEGSTMRGALTIDNITSMNGSIPFVLQGVPTPGGSRTPVLTFRLDAAGDRVDYFGTCTQPYEIVNNDRLNSQISSITSDLDDKLLGYVKTTGGTVSGHISVTSSVASREPGNNDYTPYAWVRDISVAKVLNNPDNNVIQPGYLYERNGSLYYYSFK